MSKFLLPAAGIGGVGIAGIGGYMIFKGKEETSTTQKSHTFRNKYSQAILKDVDPLWDSKFTTLKDDSTQPIHPKLAEAKTKFSSNASDENAKSLQREGCGEIYNSVFEGTTYLQDFKKYCSKTIKDRVTGTWITQESTDQGKWNPKLNTLRNHDETKNGKLDDTLKALKSQLTPNTEANLDDNNRGKLKGWCDSIKGEIFIGNKDTRFIHAQLYCVGT